MSHKQAKRIRQQLKQTEAYQNASTVTSYEKTNIKQYTFSNPKLNGKTYTISTDIAESTTQRGIYRRLKGNLKMKMFDGVGIA